LSKRIVGPGALIKTGPGILQLNEAGNIYEGGTLIQEGTLRLNAAAAGYGGITLASGSTLELLNAFTFTNAVSIPGDGATLVVNRTNVSSGAWSGNGSVTISNLGLFTFNGNIAGFGGTISLGSSSGALRFNNGSANDCLGSAAATFDLGTGSGSLYNLNGGGLTYDLGALAAGPQHRPCSRSSTSGTPGNDLSDRGQRQQHGVLRDHYQRHGRCFGPQGWFGQVDAQRQQRLHRLDHRERRHAGGQWHVPGPRDG
jgi:autotransporter-associated beta strand protein